MTSNPPSNCCIVAVKHEGTPKGEMKELNGVPTYIAMPANKSTDKAIFFIPDVLGPKFINAQLIADSFAEAGFFTVLPDPWNNDPVPPPDNRPAGFSLPEWLKSHSTDVTIPPLEKAFEGLKAEYSPKSIGSIGVCLGAKYTVHFMGQGHITAGVLNHPSFVTEDELRGLSPEKHNKQLPLLINAAETDTIFTRELRHRSEEILTEMKATYQITLFSGVEHGFTVRGNPANEHVQAMKERAFDNAVAWFKRYL